METTQQTIKNNKLIAEFMGYDADKVEVNIPKFKRLIAFKSQSIKATSIKCFESSIFKFNELQFHSSREWYRDWETDRKSTRLNSSHSAKSRMPSSA